MNETLWKLEQAQTQDRITVSQFRFWLQQLLAVWVLATVVCFGVGLREEEQRRHVRAWVIASVGQVTPLKSVSWQGRNYDPEILATHLSDTVYHGTLKEWLVWAGGLGFLLSVLFATIRWQRLQRKGQREQHIRGAELLPLTQLQARLNKRGTTGAFTIAGVKIPLALECSHSLVCGATDSGKSMTIRGRLREIANKEEPCIVVDPEGEFVREFYDPARGDWLLNPLDARCPTWSPWGEGESDADIAAQAASLFPIVPGMAEAAAYYHTAARRTYRELLKHARVHEPSHIPDMLAEEVKNNGSRLASKEVISTMQNALDAFRYLQPGSREWSARSWVENKQGWVFLSFREVDKEATLPLVSLWLESLNRRLLSQEIAPRQTTHVVIDELAVLRAQPTLVESESRGRKRGLSITLGFQDVQQLYPIYGRPLTNSLLNQPATRLLLRTNDGETQKWCADNIGERQIQRHHESETVGPAFGRDSITRMQQFPTEPAVLPSEFGNFASREGVLKVANFGAARRRVALVPLEEK